MNKSPGRLFQVTQCLFHSISSRFVHFKGKLECDQETKRPISSEMGRFVCAAMRERGAQNGVGCMDGVRLGWGGVECSGGVG